MAQQDAASFDCSEAEKDRKVKEERMERKMNEKVYEQHEVINITLI